MQLIKSHGLLTQCFADLEKAGQNQTFPEV